MTKETAEEMAADVKAYCDECDKLKDEVGKFLNGKDAGVTLEVLANLSGLALACTPKDEQGVFRIRFLLAVQNHYFAYVEAFNPPEGKGLN